MDRRNVVREREEEEEEEEEEEDSGVSSESSSDSRVYVRISVPDLNVQDLKDGLNYGLYCPHVNGRAGKFLDEERPLRDYPLATPIGYLEFKYKRRVYKRLEMNPKKLKHLQTKVNLKQLIEAVRKCDVDKVMKWLNKGIDPNFIDNETGETPLTLCAALQTEPADLLIALVSGGAHMDFRNRKGLTAMHVAVQKDGVKSVRTLLDLGASPNYRDSQGLTPLYHAVCNHVTCRFVEMLLYDHSLVGVVDKNGLSELHQACKHGTVQHVEQLIYYGADMNCQNSGGNTPLHICALNRQVECARILLFRGADKALRNFASQDASELAVISGNLELARLIMNFDWQQVVEHQELPEYNNKRRSTIPSATISNLQRIRSQSRLSLLSKTSSLNAVNNSVNNSVSNNNDPGVCDSLNVISTSKPHMVTSLLNTRVPLSLTYGDVNVSEHSDSPRLSSGFGDRSSPDTVTNDDFVDPAHPQPRTLILRPGTSGYGFVLRGAKVMDEDSAIVLDYIPTVEAPALQFFDHIDENSISDEAGIRPGDFLLQINGADVRTASHDLAVQLIQSSGDELELVVLTPRQQQKQQRQQQQQQQQQPQQQQRQQQQRQLQRRQELDDDVFTDQLPRPGVLSRVMSNASVTSVTSRSTVSSFSQYVDSRIAESLDMLDKAVAEYENVADVFTTVNNPSAMQKKLTSTGSFIDPNLKIASINSVHGKRLSSLPETSSEDSATQIQTFTYRNVLKLRRPTSWQQTSDFASQDQGHSSISISAGPPRVTLRGYAGRSIAAAKRHSLQLSTAPLPPCVPSETVTNNSKPYLTSDVKRDAEGSNLHEDSQLSNLPSALETHGACSPSNVNSSASNENQENTVVLRRSRPVDTENNRVNYTRRCWSEQLPPVTSGAGGTALTSGTGGTSGTNTSGGTRETHELNTTGETGGTRGAGGTNRTSGTGGTGETNKTDGTSETTRGNTPAGIVTGRPPLPKKKPQKLIDRSISDTREQENSYQTKIRNGGNANGGNIQVTPDSSRSSENISGSLNFLRQAERARQMFLGKKKRRSDEKTVTVENKVNLMSSKPLSSYSSKPSPKEISQLENGDKLVLSVFPKAVDSTKENDVMPLPFTSTSKNGRLNSLSQNGAAKSGTVCSSRPTINHFFTVPLTSISETENIQGHIQGHLRSSRSKDHAAMMSRNSETSSSNFYMASSDEFITPLPPPLISPSVQNIFELSTKRESNIMNESSAHISIKKLQSSSSSLPQQPPPIACPPLPPPLLSPSVQNIFALSSKENAIRTDQSQQSRGKISGNKLSMLTSPGQYPLPPPQPSPPPPLLVRAAEKVENSDRISDGSILNGFPASIEVNDALYKPEQSETDDLIVMALVRNLNSHRMTSWSVDDVADWLLSIHMEEHVDNFVKHAIDGRLLSRIGRTELIALGVTQVGQRMNIERAIKKVIISQAGRSSSCS